MLINSYRFASATTYDTDAQAYITAVETADGESLETATRDAINAFFRDCKLDGIWTAIKASCILAGARTRLGALTPLVGTAPTSFNFVDGDYNRKTGLVGNGSTKYLSANTNFASINASSLIHASCFVSATGTNIYIGGSAQNRLGGTQARVRNVTATLVSTIGFYGMNYFSVSSSGLIARNNGLNTIGSGSATGVSADGLNIFLQGTSYSTARLAFYSIGESLDLALLDTRVTALITAFSTAIP